MYAQACKIIQLVYLFSFFFFGAKKNFPREGNSGIAEALEAFNVAYL
jgi:hypothetical protein